MKYFALSRKTSLSFIVVCPSPYGYIMDNRIINNKQCFLQSQKQQYCDEYLCSDVLIIYCKLTPYDYNLQNNINEKKDKYEKRRALQLPSTRLPESGKSSKHNNVLVYLWRRRQLTFGSQWRQDVTTGPRRATPAVDGRSTEGQRSTKTDSDRQIAQRRTCSCTSNTDIRPDIKKRVDYPRARVSGERDRILVFGPVNGRRTEDTFGLPCARRTRRRRSARGRRRRKREGIRWEPKFKCNVHTGTVDELV